MDGPASAVLTLLQVSVCTPSDCSPPIQTPNNTSPFREIFGCCCGMQQHGGEVFFTKEQPTTGERQKKDNLFSGDAPDPSVHNFKVKSLPLQTMMLPPPCSVGEMRRRPRIGNGSEPSAVWTSDVHEPTLKLQKCDKLRAKKETAEEAKTKLFKLKQA